VRPSCTFPSDTGTSNMNALGSFEFRPPPRFKWFLFALFPMFPPTQFDPCKASHLLDTPDPSMTIFYLSGLIHAKVSHTAIPVTVSECCSLFIPSSFVFSLLRYHLGCVVYSNCQKSSVLFFSFTYPCLTLEEFFPPHCFAYFLAF